MGLAEELRAVREGAGVVDRSDRGRLLVRGEGRKVFLHRLVSSDVAGLAVGAGTMASLLTPKGRILAVMTVSEMGEGYFVECAAADAESLMERLTMYTLGAPVEIVDVTGPTGQVGLAGPKAAEVLAACGVSDPPATPLAFGEVEIAGVGMTLHRVENLGGVAWDLHGMDEEFAVVLDALADAGATPVSAEAAEVARIAAGIPKAGAELTEDVFPPEVPWFAERAISYTKGCYVGQEIVARIRTYGHVNRELRGLVCDAGATPVAAGAELKVDGKRAGVVTSSARLPDGPSIALALVARDHLETGTRVEVGGGVARVVPPSGPWE
jgi:aminomethyltransferase